MFSEALPPYDDAGFTNDLDVAFWRARGPYQLGGTLLHRWITEAGGPRRTDLVELFAMAERTWDGLTVGARLGPTFTGNLGGRWMQNGWHALTRSGPTLDEGLQDRYVGGLEAGVAAGTSARFAIGAPEVQLYGFGDAQLAVGTGVTFLDLAAGLASEHRVRCVRIGGHAEVALMRFHVDERLAFPGAYGDGWQGAYRVGVHVAWNRTRITYEYRANEGGSGEPFGILGVTIKQAGTRY